MSISKISNEGGDWARDPWPEPRNPKWPLAKRIGKAASLSEGTRNRKWKERLAIQYVRPKNEGGPIGHWIEQWAKETVCLGPAQVFDTVGEQVQERKASVAQWTEYQTWKALNSEDWSQSWRGLGRRRGIQEDQPKAQRDRLGEGGDRETQEEPQGWQGCIGQ